LSDASRVAALYHPLTLAVVERSFRYSAKGTCPDVDLASFTINGEATAREGGSGAFEKALFLTSGAWGTYIDVTAEDAYRNVTTVTRTVEVAPLEVEITFPTDDAVLDATSVTVTGTVKGPKDVEVFVNGQRAVRDGESFTLANFPLTEGPNTLTAHASAQHDSAEHAITVTRDTTGPIVTIYSPDDGDVIGATSVTVEGWVEDDSLQTVSVNGQPAELFGNYFIAEGVPLNTEGNNAILVVATDAVSRTGQAEVSVSRDTTPPSLTIESPTDGSVVNGSYVVVSGTYTEANLDGISVNGISAPAAGGTYDSPSIPLQEGSNVITAVATDLAGHATQVSITVTGNLPPEVEITGVVFSSKSTEEQLMLKVTGTCGDATSVTVKNEAPRLADGGGQGDEMQATLGECTFEADGLKAWPGVNFITAIATDAYGAQAKVEIIVEIDPGTEGYELPGQEQGDLPSATLGVFTGGSSQGMAQQEFAAGQGFMTFGALAEATQGSGEEPPSITVTGFENNLATVWVASDLRFEAALSVPCDWEEAPQEATLFLPQRPLDPVNLPPISIYDNCDGNSGATVINLLCYAPWWEADAVHSFRTDQGKGRFGNPGPCPIYAEVKFKKKDSDQFVRVKTNEVNVITDEVLTAKVTVSDGAKDHVVERDTEHDYERTQPLAITYVQPPGETEVLKVRMEATTRFQMLKDDISWAVKMPVMPEEKKTGKGSITIVPARGEKAEISTPLGIIYIMAFGEATPLREPEKPARGKGGPKWDNNPTAVFPWFPDMDDGEARLPVDEQGGLLKQESPVITWDDAIESAVPWKIPFKVVAARIERVEWLDAAEKLIGEPNVYYRVIPETCEAVRDTEASKGFRYFPDADTAGIAHWRRALRVRGRIKPFLKGLPVRLRWFDPDDPSDNSSPVDPNAGSGDDNRERRFGEKLPALSPEAGISDEDGVVLFETKRSAQFSEVSVYPGDNYRIAAALDAPFEATKLDACPVDGQPSGLRGRLSELLTIWRRVHYEVDLMANPRWADNVYHATWKSSGQVNLTGSAGRDLWLEYEGGWDDPSRGRVDPGAALVGGWAGGPGGGADYWELGCACLSVRDPAEQGKAIAGPFYARIKASSPAMPATRSTYPHDINPKIQIGLPEGDNTGFLTMLRSHRSGQLIMGDDDFIRNEENSAPLTTFQGRLAGTGAPIHYPGADAWRHIVNTYREAYIETIFAPYHPVFTDSYEFERWAEAEYPSIVKYSKKQQLGPSPSFWCVCVTILFQPGEDGDLDPGNEPPDCGLAAPGWCYESRCRTALVYSEVIHDSHALRTPNNYEPWLGMYIAHEARHVLLRSNGHSQWLGAKNVIDASRDRRFPRVDLDRFRTIPKWNR